MNIRTLVFAAALSLVSMSASAFDLGISAGTFQSGAQSAAGSQSVGGSAAALNGFSAQQSSAVASNNSYGVTQLSGNDSLALSGSAGFTAQQGSSLALGNSAAGNQNIAIQQGLGQGINDMSTIYLFVSP